jgi:tetratricopeptide (TPR) repeat protein
MQIKRDYSQPFFGERRRRRRLPAWALLGIAVCVGALLVFVFSQLDRLQSATLDLLGMSPTATALPSEVATRALALFNAGDTKSAAALFERVVRQRPDNLDYLYEYGQLLIELDKGDTALQIANHAIEVNPNDPRGYVLKAKALVWSGDPASAVPIALAGQKTNADFAPLYAVLARAYIGIGRFGDGLDAGKQAIALAPNDPDAHRSYAYALGSTGNGDLAIDELSQTIALDPNWIAPYFELAYQYLAANRDQDAIAVYDRVLAMQPRNAKALLRQCEAYRKIGQFERALGFCEDATAAATTDDPIYPLAYLELGNMRYNRSEFSEALASYEKCYANDPSNLECQYRRGLAHYYLKECDQAWQMLQDSLIVARSRTGEDQAIDTIRQGLTAITVDPNCPGYSGRSAPTDVPSPAPSSTPGGT